MLFRSGFLDFRSLERRRFFCEEELRLNRRLAPAVYHDVLPVTGTSDAPVLGGEGAPLDWAVRMHRFPQEALFAPMLAAGTLRPEHIDHLARLVAGFHRDAAVAPPESAFGRPERIRSLALANIDAADAIIATATRLTPALPGEPSLAESLSRVRTWTLRELDRLAPAFDARRSGGRVREGHGDLHLGNIALVDGADTFDVDAAEPDALARLLWVRCRRASEALQAADLLLRDPNFPLVVLDLQFNAARELRKIPGTVWFRFQRLPDSHAPTLLVITPFALVSHVAARVRVRMSLDAHALDAPPEKILPQLRFDLLRATTHAAEPRIAQAG